MAVFWRGEVSGGANVLHTAPSSNVLSARPDVGRSVVLRSRSLESGGALQSSRGRRPADGPRRPTRTRRAALVVRSDRTKPIRTKLRRGDDCVCDSAVARSRLLSPV